MANSTDLSFESQKSYLRDRRPITVACPAWQRHWNSVRWGNIFCTWPTRAAKAKLNLLYIPAWHAQRTNQGRTPFICTLWVPMHISFQQSAGATPLKSQNKVPTQTSGNKCKMPPNKLLWGEKALRAYPPNIDSGHQWIEHKQDGISKHKSPAT